MRRLALLFALAPVAVRAQPPQSQIRIDAIGPAPYAVHAGIGLTWRLGTYARLGVVGAYGARRLETETKEEGRADLVVRMTLDPFRQHAIGLSFGGGVSVRERPHLVAVMDVEGPALGPVSPALQFGVGFGYRAGVILRRTIPGRR